jgi:protein tyrosine phosphatase (PTP) superfamily phosphohydrolase (DUF442 family)
MFNYQVGKLPMKYFSVPITFSDLKNIDWEFLHSKLFKKFDAWICNFSSSGARSTFIYSCLSGIIPSYYIWPCFC